MRIGNNIQKYMRKILRSVSENQFREPSRERGVAIELEELYQSTVLWQVILAEVLARVVPHALVPTSFARTKTGRSLAPAPRLDTEKALLVAESRREDNDDLPGSNEHLRQVMRVVDLRLQWQQQLQTIQQRHRIPSQLLGIQENDLK